MKRVLLSIFTLLSLSQARASDTLTIRQVFNFNVGDTFDYEIQKQVVNGAIPYEYSKSFSRFVITDKMFAIDSNILSYKRTWLYPILNIDTIGYSLLDSSILYLDSIDLSPSSEYQLTIWYDSNNLLMNTIGTSGPDHSLSETYVEGLGETIFESSFGNLDDENGYTDTSLIYYSKNGISYGTPYYNQPTGINNILNTSNIQLYPNPVADQLHLSFTDASQYNTQLILTDILGQEVYSSPVTQGETTHDISKLASGIYTLRVMEDNSIIKTGKVVKQ